MGVTKKLDADNDDDDYQIGTNKHFDDLTIVLKGMRLKPTVLEVYLKDKPFSKEVNESIDQALAKAKLAVSKKPESKTVKKDDVDIFVNTFLKEIPDGKATTNIDKNKFISKLSSLPSVSSISSCSLRLLYLLQTQLYDTRTWASFLISRFALLNGKTRKTAFFIIKLVEPFLVFSIVITFNKTN